MAVDQVRELRQVAEDAGTAPGGRSREHGLYGSTRRLFRIIDAISQDPERVTAKGLAYELGVSLSTCYHLLNVLIEEGYVEKLPHRGGYKLGPTIEVLFQRSRRGGLAMVMEPILRELAHRSSRHAYFSVLADGEVTLVHAESPPGGPSLSVAAGVQGAAHALAIGKVLIAGGGVKAISDFIANHTLEAYTRHTITDPARLERHLKEVRARGYALDFEEFAPNLVCVAVPIRAKTGIMQGAIGLSTTAPRARAEMGGLIGLARQAAGRATELLPA
jgi:acetyl-CoA synthetase